MSTKDRVIRLIGFAVFCGLIVFLFAYPDVLKPLAWIISVLFLSGMVYNLLFGKN